MDGRSNYIFSQVAELQESKSRESTFLNIQCKSFKALNSAVVFLLVRKRAFDEYFSWRSQRKCWNWFAVSFYSQLDRGTAQENRHLPFLMQFLGDIFRELETRKRLATKLYLKKSVRF